MIRALTVGLIAAAGAITDGADPASEGDQDPAGPSVARRVLPPVAGLAAIAIVLSWWFRRRRR